ncbi:hypothetical protein BKA62DRAFT_701423 [Auriculariales sp. MPI-PUGE-AT-0066]|nr:hypothetical protein BKA62DRAFT_701423 [Auriculariales sp. MPI-PUGE-AT-0066]
MVPAVPRHIFQTIKSNLVLHHLGSHCTTQVHVLSTSSTDMKFFALMAMALAAATSTAAFEGTLDNEGVDADLDLVGATRNVGEADGASLVKRACTPDGCDCQGIAKGALFCGDGFFGCKVGNVYQCNKNDGRTTCTFGIRKSCQQCGKLQC